MKVILNKRVEATSATQIGPERMEKSTRLFLRSSTTDSYDDVVLNYAKTIKPAKFLSNLKEPIFKAVVTHAFSSYLGPYGDELKTNYGFSDKQVATLVSLGIVNNNPRR